MVNTPRVFDGSSPIPAAAIESVDANVAKELPRGCKIKEIYQHGQSYFTQTAAIVAELEDGSEARYFLKVLDTLYKVKGEFLSMQAIHAATPEAAPAPLAYGTYASDLKLHFILLPYIAMTDEPPTFDLLVVLKRLHMSTTSPTGKFGLEHPTYHHHVAAWTDTWEEYFTRHMRQCMAVETSTHGSTLEIEELHQKTLELVIPRLLRPMETGGRKLKPSLVHGDLWEGNTSMELKPYRATIFDAGSLYAHNEYEFGAMRPERHKMKRPYIEEYFRLVPPAFPQSDAWDRNLLYCVRFDIVASSNFKGLTRFRDCYLKDMKYLVDKYAGGYEEWAAQNPELIKEAKPEAEKGTEARNSPISPTSQSPFVEKSGSSQETADARPAGSRFARLRQRLLCR